MPAGKRGRKTKACHQCARVKVYCNGRDQTPCERCVSRELHCSFSRSLADATHQQSTTIQEQDQSHSENLVHGGRVPLSFLLNVTDAKQDFITEKAVGEEPDAALLGPTCVTPPQSRALGDAGLHYIEPTLLFLGGLYNTEVEDQNLLGAFLSPSSQEDRLSERLDLLELHVAAHASSGDRYRGSFDSASFRNFFSVSNVNTFAMIFCRKRHYQFPVIHWPTFALEEASPPLLMVVALTGATYSYRPGHPPEHITGARKLYHLADSYVFHQLVECLDHIPSDIDLVEAIQLCQAALLMYALDTLSATDSAMQHMAMTQRLPALISTMRRLGFIGLRHQPSEDWQLFLQREHIIRLVSWTFCADCIATMSCNNLPILSTMEMSGDLPCDPGLWEIDSSSDFEILKSSHQGTSHCLKDLMPKFLHENGEGDIDWESLPLFHLHIMLCGEFRSTPRLHGPVCLVDNAIQKRLLIQTCCSITTNYFQPACRHVPNTTVGKAASRPWHVAKPLGKSS